MGAGGALTGVGPGLCLWEAFVAPDVQHLHEINRKDSKLSQRMSCLLTIAIAPLMQNQSRSTPQPYHSAPNQPYATPKSNNNADTYNTKFYTELVTPNTKSNTKQITSNTKPNTKVPTFNFKSSLSLHQTSHTQCQIPVHSTSNQSYPISKSLTQQYAIANHSHA